MKELNITDQYESGPLGHLADKLNELIQEHNELKKRFQEHNHHFRLMDDGSTGISEPRYDSN